MKQFIFLFILSAALCSNFAAQAQNNTGMVMEDDRYQKVARLGFGMNFSGNEQAKASLRKYCPTPKSQGGMGSCVGWSVGFAGLTVAQASSKGISDVAQINQITHSALYVYNQIKVSGCDEGARITDALDLLQKKGDCLMSDFSPTDCSTQPSAQNHAAASSFRIKDYGTLFEVTASESVKISTTTKSIAEGKPVVIGMLVTPSFKQLHGSFWKPSDTEVTQGGHAMLVVGYDDMKKTMEVMNSWGTSWGDGGFFTLSYETYAKYVKYGYQINMAENKPNIDSKVQLSGDFVFNKYNIEASQTSNTDVYEEVTPTLSGNYYTLPDGTCDTETYFQLIAKNIKKDAYVYVFSVKPDGDAEVLFPSDKSFSKEAFGVSIKQLPRALANNVVITIPNPESNAGMTTDQSGKDHLCILYSDKVLDDIQQIVLNVKKDIVTSKDFNQSLQNVLADRLIPQQNLQYKPAKMSVKAASATGYIAPIVLQVNVAAK